MDYGSGYEINVREQLRAILYEQTRLIDFAIQRIVDNENSAGEALSDTRRVVVMMLQAAGVSVHSLIKLTDNIDMGVRDCFGIARSIAETCLNIAYIIAEGEAVAAKAMRHALQKSYRDLQREGTLGGMRFFLGIHGNPPDPSTIEGLQEALDEFSDKKGRGKGWTDQSVEKRLERVSSRFNGKSLGLSGAVLTIYRHSSEVLHGTFSGVIYFWSGGTIPPSNRKEAESIFFGHFISVFSCAFFSVSSLMEIMEDAFEWESGKKQRLAQFLRVQEIISSPELDAALARRDGR